MQHPVVSVIVPVYNVLPYLQESLDSLLVQTYPLMEILIIDDGSTDGSGAVCDAYQEKDTSEQQRAQRRQKCRIR